MDPPPASRRSARRRARQNRIRRLIAFGVAAVLAAGTIGAAAVAPAMAAPGDLGVTVDWVDLNDDEVTDLTASAASQTDLQARLVGLRVGYSCGPVTCTAASIKIDPMPLDPEYGSYRFAAFSSATLPSGATRSGGDAAGFTISLGTLAPGSSGSFVMLYTYQVRGSSPSPQSFFPEGFVAQARATISATGFTSETATDAVTWHISTPSPAISFFTSSSSATTLGTARADSEYTYTVYMTSGCLWEGGGHGEPMYECAGSYTAHQTLPAGAVFVSASHGGAYDAGTNTVTWTDTGKDAATGWGLLTGAGSPRSVVVRFPSSLITNPAECVLTLTSGLSVDTTYLSGATGTASSSATHTLNGCVPFGAGSSEKFSSSSFATGNSDTVVWAGTSHQWTVRVFNRSNVPAVGTVTETFDQAGLRVNRVTSTSGAATMTLTLDNGAVVTYTGTDYSAPTGRSIASATVVTPVIAGPNNVVTDQSKANFVPIRFYYTVTGTVPADGFTRTNTAQVSLSFPDNPELNAVTPAPASATVLVTRKPATLTPTLSASVPGGGNPVSGQVVTFTMAGRTSDQETGVDFQPQYVFVAPAGWTVQPGSASIAGVGDAVYTYKTVMVNGESRQAVYATRPGGAVWGVNTTWPTMTVKASPGAGLAANTLSTAEFYQGDAQHNYGPRSAIWGATAGNAWGSFRYEDAADLDGDGVLTESYAYTTASLRIGSAAGLVVIKEICRPDVAQADGCQWVADASAPVSVSPATSGITYRVTISNGGNTALANVVGYDVLPHPGDTGITSSSAGTPRGSDLTEQVVGVSGVSGMTLAYSSSTSPCRPQVHAGAPGCVDDWNGTAAGAQAIRMMVGTLAAGASAQFSYAAGIVGTPTAGDVACNSVAVSSTSTPATEPPAVCARVDSADLAASGPASVDAQLNRPTAVPLTFENLAGTTTAATVTIELTSGVSVTDLAPTGWTCAASSAAPVAGPSTLTCTQTPDFAVGFPATMELATVVTAAGSSITASIEGPVFDPDTANNAHTTTFVTAPAAAGIPVTKSDGLSALAHGQTLTYTIRVTNPLAFESLGTVTITDALPAGLQFVSATKGGTDDAGVVTWSLTGLAPGATDVVSVTVTVLDTVAGPVTNGAQATAADPAFPGRTLTGSASDTDAFAALSLTKNGAASVTTDPRPGDTVTYTFVARNSGGAPLSEVAIADAMPGLSALVYGTWPGTSGRLGVGEQVTATAVYTLTQEDIDAGEVVNTATASAETAEGTPVDGTATASLRLGQDPAIHLEKSGTAPTATAGDLASFDFTATNTGNVTLTDVTIVDHLGGVSALAYTWPGSPGVLAPGQSATATATFELRQSDVNAEYLDNSATAEGRPPAGGVVTADAEVRVMVPSTTELTLTKSASVAGAGPAAVGDVVTWTFVLRNTGDVTLTDADVQDPFPGLSTLDYVWPTGTPGLLAPLATPTATATSTLTQADIDRGFVQNAATATARTPSGAEARATGDTRLDLVQRGALTLTKSGSIAPGDVEAGDIVHYSFAVENTGNVTLSDVSIADALPGISAVAFGTWPGEPGELAPGASVTATAEYAVRQGDLEAGTVHNTAVATGRTSTGGDVSGTDEEDVALAATADIRLVKAGSYADGPIASAGGRVAFTFEVTNTGHLILTDVGIADGMSGLSDISFGTWPGAIGVLEPGQTVTATAEYLATQQDVDAGEVVNAATAEGTPGVGAAVTSEDEVTVTLTAATGLSVVKSASLDDADRDGKAGVGEKITYSFAVTNTGTATVADVSIDDPRVAVAGTIASLAPGQTLTLTSALYTVTAADAKAGKIVNTATARGSLPSSALLVSAPSTVTTKAGVNTSGVKSPSDVAKDAELARTGERIGMGALAVGALLVIAGVFIVMSRRRRQA